MKGERKAGSEMALPLSFLCARCFLYIFGSEFKTVPVEIDRKMVVGACQVVSRFLKGLI